MKWRCDPILCNPKRKRKDTKSRRGKRENKRGKRQGDSREGRTDPKEGAAIERTATLHRRSTKEIREQITFPWKTGSYPYAPGFLTIPPLCKPLNYTTKFCEKFTIKKNPSAKSYKNEKIQSKELNPVT